MTVSLLTSSPAMEVRDIDELVGAWKRTEQAAAERG